VPHHRLLDGIRMSGELVADRRSDEVGAIGVEALVHQQIDMAKVDESDVDCDFLRNGGQRVWAGAGSPSALGSGSFRLLVRCRFEPPVPIGKKAMHRFASLIIASAVAITPAQARTANERKYKRHR
jgi:hypothetical protein